ncbi:hypothetical protein [Marisediminicola senii]|uniref:hypothetical protein n=1 Tax=Marisediminicola senii TaxID=2711233 RepID=UPI0013EBF23A|nr:hypothetical protein [Marisediminicola senii]
MPLAAAPAADATAAGAASTVTELSTAAPSAAPTVSPTPSPSAEGVTPTQKLEPFSEIDEGRPAAIPGTTITTDPAGFTPTGTVNIGGTKQSGSSVEVTLGTGATLCEIPETAATNWSCTGATLPNGAAIRLVATESVPDGTAAAPGETTVDVLAPPTIDGDGAFLTTGLVSGRGHANSTVRVTIDGVVDANCSAVPVQSTGYWACNTARPTGGPFVIRAQQSNGAIAGGQLSAYSPAQRVTIDRDAPASAVITSPTNGGTVASQTFTVSGTGEDRGNIDVYLDNVPVCSTVVSGSTWDCVVAGMTGGSHTLVAVQRDAAGNYASPSTPVQVSRAAASTSPSPSTTSPSPSTNPGRPSPTTQPDNGANAPLPGDPTNPGDPGDPGSGGSGGSADGDDAGVPPVAPTDEVPPNSPDEALSNWGSPTTFGTSLAAPATSATAASWYTAPLLALLFLALIALPLRVLSSTVRERYFRSGTQLTGRNQDRRHVEPEAAPGPVAAWLASGILVTVAAVFIALTGGVSGEVRYLRLFLAIALGLVVLNIVGTVVAIRLGGMVARIQPTLRFLPVMLLAAAIAAVVSRTADLEPPLVVGVFGGAAFAAATPLLQRAQVNLVQLGVTTALAATAWLVNGVVGPGQGFWALVASETLTTICLAGLGSAMVMSLPIASLPGRAILEWSRPAWLATVLVIATITASIVFGEVHSIAAMLPWMLAAAAFAALSLATWAFVRFIEPQNR